MGDPITIIGTAMQVGSGVMSAAGEARADSFRAAEANAAARRGKIAASETDAHLREVLRETLGNIRAVQASAGISPDSPTSQAILDNESRVSDRERRIRVANIDSQVRTDQASSEFLKQSGRDKFLYGTLGSFGRGFSSLAGGSR